MIFLRPLDRHGRAFSFVDFENVAPKCYYCSMITLKEIEKLALLSRIDLAPEEKEAFRKDMDAILGYVEQVQKVSGALDVNKKAGNLRNVLREDANPHESGIHTETLISAAPKREGNRVKVKKIL